MQTRQAMVFGMLRHRPGVLFHGQFNFELRPDRVYYTWRMETDDGEWLCTVSRPVSLRLIPEDQNAFDFSLNHAVDGLRRYRINQEHLFKVTRWEWIEA